MFKKLLVCGASLLIIASVGTGINNVSARRIHHHARTYRAFRSSRSLYKQGEHDNDAYAGPASAGDSKRTEKVYKYIINNLIKFHFNKSYIKGLDLLNPKIYNGFSGASAHLYTPILSEAKKVEQQRNRKSVKRHYAVRRTHKINKKSHKFNKNHGKRIRRVGKHTKRIRSRKYGERVMAKKHYVRKNKHHTVKRHVRKLAKPTA